ncbi:UNVERIFIED_CONTAM: hypothetical protein K2H54_057469 [Gekko kuhli]
MWTLQVGDKVLIHRHAVARLGPDVWTGPYVVRAVVGPVTYRVQTSRLESQTRTLHINHLKRWQDRDTPAVPLAILGSDASIPCPEWLPQTEEAPLLADDLSESQRLEVYQNSPAKKRRRRKKLGRDKEGRQPSEVR